MAWTPPGRQSWDAWCLELARVASSRATCPRNRQGAVLVTTDRRVVATGWTGTPSGIANCTELTCGRPGDAQPAATCAAVHAVANVVIAAAPLDRRAATLYTTGAPCWECAKLVANAGIGEVVASGGRDDSWEQSRQFLLDVGLRVRVLDGMDELPRLDLD